VHYRGNFFPDLLGGQVQVTINPTPSSIDFIRAGKLRALAVTTATRQEVLPDIPTVGDPALMKSIDDGQGRRRRR
jgi:tripartite-type tricarboxylate transporter receptor subunit TctC